MVNDCPELGDLVWLQFSPTSGTEQAGHRPALVISPTAYNQKTGLLVACPITSRVRGHSFEVALEGTGISGVVLVDHLRSLSWRARKAEFIEPCPDEVVARVKAIVAVFLSS